MLPTDWIDSVFPVSLRENRGWINQFGKTRRTYLFGFGHTNEHLRRRDLPEFREKLSDQFKEDPRRVVPHSGWREHFKHDGEIFSETENYKVAPIGRRREPCSRWGAYGKDQAEHAWLIRPMRLYDALKSVAALYEAKAIDGDKLDIIYSKDSFSRHAGELALHVAIFNLTGLDLDYYNLHIANAPSVLARLYDRCGLWRNFNGAFIPTFSEMAQGLSATYRTCELLRNFARSEGLPDLGEIVPDLSSRGTNRHERQKVKAETRIGILKSYSADCAVEIFTQVSYDPRSA